MGLIQGQHELAVKGHSTFKGHESASTQRAQGLLSPNLLSLEIEGWAFLLYICPRNPVNHLSITSIWGQAGGIKPTFLCTSSAEVLYCSYVQTCNVPSLSSAESWAWLFLIYDGCYGLTSSPNSLGRIWNWTGYVVGGCSSLATLYFICETLKRKKISTYV